MSNLSDAINEMGNALTAAEWPVCTVHTPDNRMKTYDSRDAFRALVFAQMDMEARLAEMQDAVNELCLKCGDYRREHEGACDGCRWLVKRRGW